MEKTNKYNNKINVEYHPLKAITFGDLDRISKIHKVTIDQAYDIVATLIKMTTRTMDKTVIFRTPQKKSEWV